MRQSWEEGFVLACSSRESFHHGWEEVAAEGRAVRKAWGQEAVDHMASAIKRPGEMNAGVQLTVF